MILDWPDAHRPVALITGGAGGIGHAIAMQFLARSIDVVVVDIRRATAEPDSGLAAAENKWHYVYGDLSDGPSRADAVQAVKRITERIDILVNCAGVLGGAAGWQHEASVDVREMLELNYVAALDLCQRFVPEMVQRRRGRVINMSSIYGSLGSPSVVTYSATKAALLVLTRSLAAEVGRFGVTVNCISPGHIDTAMTRSGGETYIADVVARTPVNRLGTAQEVARVANFLIDSPFINGAEIVIDGGLSIVAG